MRSGTPKIYEWAKEDFFFVVVIFVKEFELA